MKKEILDWLQNIEKQDGTPPEQVIVFNFGLIESDEGYKMYLVGGFEYSEEDDNWAIFDLPTKDYRYLKLPDDMQDESWENVLEIAETALKELEKEGALNKTLVRKAKALTTGFDDGELIKIR
ncbi:hypothetical protein [Chondrinema litorale]|uniref:hypothetical protein n=1 Tax=Chondrinema litorale TaxID=2994555 RepID=UPI0025426E0F|nr:hypothetical protein [Chondrinema litorale]UZR97219.1 hypothetical protein OQ292_25300 [Chondrinema litorale]